MAPRPPETDDDKPTLVGPNPLAPDADATPIANLPGEGTRIEPLKSVAGEIRSGRPVDEQGLPVDDPGEATDPALRVPALLNDTLTAAAQAQSQKTFAPQSRGEILAHLGLTEGRVSPVKPAPRQITYLIIDAATAEDKKAYSSLRSEIGLIKDARDFQVTKDDQGNIVIIALSERGGLQKLLAISRSIVRERPTARMALKSGTTDYTGDNFSIVGYPQAAADAIWQTAAITPGNTGVFIDQDLARAIGDPGSRIGSGIEITTEAFAETETAANFLALTSFRSRIRLEQGGPDRLIGYGDQLEDLAVYTGIALPEGADEDTDETKLIVVEGSAGMGKSRLIAEVLANHPSYVLASVDAADKNVVGSSLVTVATQLITALKDDPILGLDTVTANRIQRPVIDGEIATIGDLRVDSIPITLSEFASWPYAEQVQFAAKQPQTITNLCCNALTLLNFGKAPNTLFVLEDTHHADRVSLPFLTQLIGRYLKDTKGRAVMSMRPEEMYRSTAVEDLEARVRREQVEKHEPVAKVSVTEGLDLANNVPLAHDFAFYSLPVEIRTNRRIATWFQTLAKAAGKSPWVMKSLMDTMLEVDPAGETYKYLVVTDTLVDVDPAILARIDAIDPVSATDIATYFHERIENLDETTRKILQAIALMGGKATTGQISALTTKFGRHGEAILETIRKLLSGGYLQKLDKNTYGLQHEATRAIVIGSLRDERTKIALAVDLYDQFRDDAEIHPDARHELLSIIAQSKDFAPRASETFWEDYARATDDSLAYCYGHNDTVSAHKIAMSVLASPILQAEIEKLKTGNDSPATTLKLAITALFAQAENARLLGRFDEVDEAAGALTTIHQYQPEAVSLDRAHIVKFLKAYMTPDTGEMRQVFEQDLRSGTDLPTPIRVMLEIKLAYRERRFNDAIALFNANKEELVRHSDAYQQAHKIPLPEFIEIMRIVYANCTLERARQSLIHPTEGTIFDQDVLMQPLAVTTDEQRADIEEADRNLNHIYGYKTSYPLIFDPYSEIQMLDQMGTLAALRGRPDQADRLFGETWRVAMQMGVYPAAARSAKLQGDIRIIQALKEGKIDRQKVLEAIAIYSEQGLNLTLSRMSPESIYQRLLRIQRIRAVGILLRSHALGFEPGEFGDLARVPVLQTLKPRIEQALLDFKYLNESWPQTAQDREMCYDIMGYINYILYVAQNLSKRPEQSGLRVNLDENLYSTDLYPMMDIRAVASGREFGDTSVTDHGFGEVDRKRHGLNALVEALREKNTRGLTEAKFRAAA